MPAGGSWEASGEPLGGSLETYWGSFGGLFRASWGLVAVSGVSLGRISRNLSSSSLSWAPLLLGLSWGPIGHLLDRLEALLIRLGTLLGGSWTVLDAVKAPKANMLKTHVFRKDWDDFCNLGLVCGAVEALLRRLGRLLCRLGRLFGNLGALLGGS